MAFRRAVVVSALLWAAPAVWADSSTVFSSPQGVLPLEDLRVFTKAYEHIRSAYINEIDDKTLLEYAIRGMLNELDPHSAYLDASSYGDLQIHTTGEFGGLGMRVTHAWTQEPDTTQRLAAACGIDEVVGAPAEMLGQVDAVVIARDDHENHAELAMPFLNAGLPVFVDKPLTLDLDELRTFAPYLRSGQLTSCSGMRFAKELDAPRAEWPAYGTVRLVRGAILNDWARYGVLLVDGIFGVTRARPLSVRALPSPHASVAAEMDDGSLLQLDALGDVGRCFRFEFYGTLRFEEYST